jgi:hypothetical protein
MKGKKTIKNKERKRGRKIKTQISKKSEREKQKQKEAVTKSNSRLQMSGTTNRTETQPSGRISELHCRYITPFHPRQICTAYLNKIRPCTF